MQTNSKPDTGYFDVPFYVSLFNDGEAEGGESGESQTNLSTENQPAQGATVKTVVKTAKPAIKHPSESEEAYQLRVELDEAKAAAQSAKDRITELNAENLRRRKAAEALESRLNTADKRVIRAEAVEALQGEGVINKRIVDLFLADIGDKAKIDPNTGDAIGIRENLAAWKELNKDFFKAAIEQSNEQSGGSSENANSPTEIAKKNATSTGASTGGSSASKASTGGLPDLRTLSPKERATALAAYKRSQRGG